MTTLSYVAGSDSTPVLNVRNELGKVIDFGTATRFVAVFNGADTSNNFTVDTDTATGAITGTALGDISFNLADTSITEGMYVLNLTVYDNAHTDGQRVADECCGPYLCMNVCGTHVE